MKSEPDVFSLEDLKEKKQAPWDGVRNYMARNYMMKDMLPGDLVIFYYSNANPSGAAGLMKVVSAPHPDMTAFDKKSSGYDEKSKRDKPTWFCVDVEYVSSFEQQVNLDTIKKHPKLKNMVLLKNSRLSVQPVTQPEFEIILELSKKPVETAKPKLCAKIGVLGSGQLARMLIQAGHKLGHDVGVFAQNNNDPGAQVTSNLILGELTDKKKLATFFENNDFITVESEFLDTDTIQSVLNSSKFKNKVFFPGLDILSMLSDRKTQKGWLDKNSLPTAKWIHTTDKNEVVAFFKDAKSGVVAKKRKFGYDGYGTTLIRESDELGRFLKSNTSVDGFIFEQLIPFKSEKATQFFRNAQGNVCQFPMVEWQAKDSKCFWVKGPDKMKLPGKLVGQIEKALHQIHYVGSIAFEFFLHKNDLVINEVAPRVHNSGHHSQDSLAPDQFTLHLMCGLGYEIPKSTNPKSKGFAMVNLIGDQTKDCNLMPCPDFHGGNLHWYGKMESRPGRKMGHINTLGESPELALAEGLKLEQLFKKSRETK
jgi:5-(carboxyamino)imidazole ribonucleotide synthase